LYLPGTASASLAGASSTRSVASHKASKQYSLAFVNPASANSYQIAYQCGIVQYAKSEGFNLTSVADNSTFTVEAQIPLLQAAAAKNPAALITDPTSPTAITATLKQIVSRGTKVALYDNPLGVTNVATGDVESDSYSGGVALAKYFVKATGGKGSVLFIEIEAGNLASNQRIVGFESVTKNYPGIKIYGPYYDDFTASKDAAIVDSALARLRRLNFESPAHEVAVRRFLPYKP
jgi:ABC-type sugar transport system substrate-binding protein